MNARPFRAPRKIKIKETYTIFASYRKALYLCSTKKGKSPQSRSTHYVTYRVMKRIFQSLIVILLLAACQGDKARKPEDIFSEQSSGVVVLLNSYFYEMRMPQGAVFYFTGVDENGSLQGLTFDRAEAEKSPAILTGTAFFVGKNGELLTNRHVASPVIDKTQARNNMIKYLQGLKLYLQMEMQQLAGQYAQLEEQKQNAYSYDYFGNLVYDYSQANQINSAQQTLSDQYDELEAAASQIDLNIDPAGITITPVCQLGIAYNNTYVTKVEDFIGKNPCVVTEISDKENVDLALVQLKNQLTPEKSYIFHVNKTTADKGFFEKVGELFGGKETEKKGLQINEQLYMMGYNAGLVLANTKQGIKVQMTGGKVTQLPDGERLVYSIPTMQGSSGSPVVDESGQLVAVNFAKLSGTDNFNFGIPLEKVKDFLAKAGVH